MPCLLNFSLQRKLFMKYQQSPLQVTIYCGVPAGVDSFRIAKEAIAEYERENG